MVLEKGDDTDNDQIQADRWFRIHIEKQLQEIKRAFCMRF
jgi:hypothetical protein